MNFTQTNRDQSLNQNPPNLVTDSCAPDQTIITIRRYHRPLGPLLTAHLVTVINQFSYNFFLNKMLNLYYFRDFLMSVTIF